MDAVFFVLSLIAVFMAGFFWGKIIESFNTFRIIREFTREVIKVTGSRAILRQFSTTQRERDDD